MNSTNRKRQNLPSVTFGEQDHKDDEALYPVVFEELVQQHPQPPPLNRRRVLLVYNGLHACHDGKMNENAGRVQAVKEELLDRGIWQRCVQLGLHDLLPPSRSECMEEEILSLCSEELIEDIRNCHGRQATWNCGDCTLANNNESPTCRVCGAEKKNSNYIIPPGKTDVYLCEGSLLVALNNIQLCIEGAIRLLDGDSSGLMSGFSLVRPPGHHASSEYFGSYCLLNTVGLVAKSILTKKLASRIFILDWDVHHGDGTQRFIIEEDEDPEHRGCITFVSIHRHDENFWPKSGGMEEGDENIVNVPLRGQGYGDSDYYFIFERVVLPLIRQSRPDIILVSAGYDCAAGDLLGRFNVSPAGFGSMTRMIASLDIPVLFVLEGGYDIDGIGEKPHMALRKSVAATVESMLEIAENDRNNMQLRLPSQWINNVRKETIEIVHQIRSKKQAFIF